MGQDKCFQDLEGDAWFDRNRDAITDQGRTDYPLLLFELMAAKEQITSVIELGCSNGFRLAKLKTRHHQLHCVGIDCSEAALTDGRKRYPEVEFFRGMLTDLPVDGPFDLVIVNLVLCWVGRENLASAVAEIDRVTADGGFLIIGDHFPDHNQKRRYHHNLSEQIYTYKQNYAAIFEALGTYRELARISYNHDHPGESLQATASDQRAACMLLKKALYDYYPEVQP